MLTGDSALHSEGKTFVPLIRLLLVCKWIVTSTQVRVLPASGPFVPPKTSSSLLIRDSVSLYRVARCAGPTERV